MLLLNQLLYSDSNTLSRSGLLIFLHIVFIFTHAQRGTVLNARAFVLDRRGRLNEEGVYCYVSSKTLAQQQLLCSSEHTHILHGSKSIVS